MRKRIAQTRRRRKRKGVSQRILKTVHMPHCLGKCVSAALVPPPLPISPLLHSPSPPIPPLLHSLSSAYDPAEFEHLAVSADLKELFHHISRYTPQIVELDTKLKPFVPEYIPAIGDIDAFLKVCMCVLGSTVPYW